MDYISYSQYKSYTSCPRNWYLSKIRKAEEKQTWYLPMGTAVHNMIEDYLKSDSTSSESALRADAYFYPLIHKQMLIEPDTSKWLAGGPADNPLVKEKALKKVSECFSKAVEELEAIEVWEVEYDASGRLPGLSVPLKAYIDIIGEHKKKGPVILDWKTGSTKPDNFQLETYGALLSHNGFNAPKELSPKDKMWGRYVMLSPTYTSVTRYVDLSAVNPAEVGAKYQKVYERMQKKIYKANPGFNCRFCFNQDNCLANKGETPRSLYYDRSSRDGIPY